MTAALTSTAEEADISIVTQKSKIYHLLILSSMIDNLTHRIRLNIVTRDLNLAQLALSLLILRGHRFKHTSQKKIK